MVTELEKIAVEVKKHYQPHGSSVKEPLVLAVSKLQSIEKIRMLSDHGQKAFGENYVQEALLKQNQLKELNIEWHLIGHLQKNKIKNIVGQFNLVHSVDTLELAILLNRKSEEKKIKQKILLQVNLGGEESKSGFEENELKKVFTEIKNFSSLEVRGLMTMPPLSEEGEKVRPYFRRLRELRDQLGVVELSMGTSHDFRIALEEGATIIRLGTILFGERPSK